MNDILIIRSVSMQQMDLCFPVILEKFKGCTINILTHEHGVESMKKYSFANEIFTYAYKTGFQKNKKAKSLKDKTFDAVIIPVTNITGSSFENVFNFSQTIKSKKYFFLNAVLELHEINKFDISIRFLRKLIYKSISMIFTPLFLIISFILILISLVFKKLG